MGIALYFMTISLLKFTNSYESDSAEGNKIEASPVYDTIIFSDVVDIINDMNKNMKSPFHEFENTESESDENIEDLLLEYQTYLNKAHDQRKVYLEKFNKTKNKVPLLRHESFVKSNMLKDFRYNNYFTHGNYNPNIFKLPSTSYNSPMDFFVPYNPALRAFNKPELLHSNRDFKDGNLFSMNKIGIDGIKTYNTPMIPKFLRESIKPTCVCKPGEISCKQCLTPNVMIHDIDKKEYHQIPMPFDSKLSERVLEDMADKAHNTLNVRIKVDVQLPKMQDITYNKNDNRDSVGDIDETLKEWMPNIRLPTAYFNFPLPMDAFGFKKIAKNMHDSYPIHKISIHKKKKSRSNINGNKKHRKKLIPFHNVKLKAPEILKSLHVEGKNISSQSEKVSQSINMSTTISSTTINTVSTSFPASSTTIPLIVGNTTQTEDSFYLMVNISNNNENETDDVRRIGNSIELEYKSNTSTETPTENIANQRQKRDTEPLDKFVNLENNTKSSNLSLKLPTNNNHSVKKSINNLKLPNRNVLPDSELLYWPTSVQNQKELKVKNITDIILERENRKAKLNMTKDAIRNNHTRALEQAIFGNVDWNDMDTIAPTFISFVGKYINGTLTFCSDTVCHSMKCGGKTCVHRTCTPEQRFNRVGHCTGCNKTDSVASMESIMDLPSNVAFEIVDILQDKMLGKLYGKVTLCISSKCISFSTAKKTFIKLKCSSKNLNKSGHCPHIKKS